MKKIILEGQSTYDGAGVKLKRIFARRHAKLTDPFLLLDHFGSDNPDDYIKGFPWHPHRGIETVTYMLDGTVEHGDSIGNSGTIGNGRYPMDDGRRWCYPSGNAETFPRNDARLTVMVNLPAKNKMMEPRYRGILESEVPVVRIPEGEVRVIAGAYQDVNGPVRELIVDVIYLDVRLEKGMTLLHEAREGYTSFCYVIKGTGEVDDTKLEQGHLMLFTEAGNITVKAIEDIHYIFVTGKQLGEPIAWGGPIVMNTQEELDIAFRELEQGTFIKKKKK